jgi:cation diffusion facilitator family transporter
LQRVVVLVSTFLFGVKLAAYWVTGSVSVLTDALESTVNIVTSLVGLYSLYVAAQPRDDNHPYGHGKAELIAASLEGTLLAIAGGVIVYESVAHLLGSPPLHKLDFGILILLSTALVNFLLGRFCLRVGRKNHSTALISSGKHLQSDMYSTLGIITGLVLLKITGAHWIDGAAALVFGSLIIYQGVEIVRTAVGGIMDEADKTLLTALIEILNKNKIDSWIDLHNLRIIKYGSLLHLDCHLTVPWYFPVREAQKSVAELENLVAGSFNQALEMFVHLDGCAPPDSCGICPLGNCTYRQSEFRERVEWKFQNITENQTHA